MFLGKRDAARECHVAIPAFEGVRGTTFETNGCSLKLGFKACFQRGKAARRDGKNGTFLLTYQLLNCQLGNSFVSFLLSPQYRPCQRIYLYLSNEF